MKTYTAPDLAAWVAEIAYTAGKCHGPDADLMRPVAASAAGLAAERIAAGGPFEDDPGRAHEGRDALVEDAAFAAGLGVREADTAVRLVGAFGHVLHAPALRGLSDADVP